MKKLTEDNLCPECGNDRFILAEDYTRYTLVETEAGVLVTGACSEEVSPADHAVRFFCDHCGEYLEVLDELLG